MDTNRLTKIKNQSNELLTLVFGDNIIDYELDWKDYEGRKIIGGFSPSSMDHQEPKIYLNKDIENMFVEEGIYDKKTRTIIEIDTLIHEYGHLIYELMSDNTLMGEKLNEFLRRELEEELQMEGEDGDISIYRNGILEEEGLDEEEVLNYLQYESEEIFAEDFVKYVRAIESNKSYMEVTGNISISKKRKEVYEIFLKEVMKEKIELFDFMEEMRFKRISGYEYKRTKNDETVSITMYVDGEEVGDCSYKEMDMDSFIEYEIDQYLKEQEAADEFDAKEEEVLLEFKSKNENKDMAYVLDFLEISADKRGNGYGKKLLQHTLKEISKHLFENENSIVYLNASPISFSMPLNRLTKFYKQQGFNVLLEQSNNNLMTINDCRRIKTLDNQEDSENKPTLNI